MSEDGTLYVTDGGRQCQPVNGPVLAVAIVVGIFVCSTVVAVSVIGLTFLPIWIGAAIHYGPGFFLVEGVTAKIPDLWWHLTLGYWTFIGIRSLSSDTKHAEDTE